MSDLNSEQGVLNRAQINQFWRDGYLKFRKVIDDRQIASLTTALDRVIEDELNREDDDGLPPEFRYGHQRGGQGGADRAIHQFVNMWKVVPDYEEVIHNPAITGAIRDLMRVDGIRIWHDQVISKPPGDNKKFGFHHDFYFWPLDRPRMITCWLALDRATVDNGCMHNIPGSHRDPRYQPVGCDLSEDIFLAPEAQGPGEPGSLYDPVRTWDVDRARPVELEPGECMFHHCLNYHMTPQNVTDRQRRAFVMIYMPDGTRYNRAQSPNHPCTNYLNLTDGAVMGGPGFPICGA
ncbi:MAG TPA: phytanoyl-CoA dioxygenase family protein [Armatimonadota bacterium]|nr:phytanoyl-CoA dioxygenase family protein [Armatimonadota bacterium]